MKINTFKNFTGDSLKNIKRNRTLSIASIATVAATLFILGVFLLTAMNVQQGTNAVTSKVVVKVFLKDDITVTDQTKLENALKNTDGVKDVSFMSKKDAYEDFKQQLGEKNKDILEGIDDTTLPSSFVVSVDKPEYASKVADAVKNFPGIDSIQNKNDVVQKIIIVTSTIKWVGIGLFVILIGVSLFLISNTIKLTVYSRRREIAIMKYIGATDWFIRWPYIIEGLIIGFIGALVATGLLYGGYIFAYNNITKSYIITNFIEPTFVLYNISWEFLLGGILIGIVGSILAIRKFLHV